MSLTGAYRRFRRSSVDQIQKNIIRPHKIAARTIVEIIDVDIAIQTEVILNILTNSIFNIKLSSSIIHLNGSI